MTGRTGQERRDENQPVIGGQEIDDLTIGILPSKSYTLTHQ
jgi:hypothetical protein